MENLSPELQKAVAEILAKLDKKHAENVDIVKKTAEDVAAFGKVQEGTKEAVAKMNTDVQALHGRMKDIELAQARAAEPESRGGGGVGEMFL